MPCLRIELPFIDEVTMKVQFECDVSGLEALTMSDDEKPAYPPATREISEQRNRLAPGPAEAFRAFSQSVFADGALSAKAKQLIAVAVAHVTQCPYCIRGHTRSALRHGAAPEEIMEAIWVAAEMRAGGAYAHSTVALHEMASHSDSGDKGAIR